MKILLIIVGLLAILFLIMVAYLYLNQRNILYYPQSLDRRLPHVKENEGYEVEFQRESVRLKGWLLRQEKNDLLIYYGGNAEEVSFNIAEFEQLNSYAVLLVNYRGYGESGGKPTEAGLVEDALAIFDQVKGDYESVSLIGRSLGSGVAVQVADQRTIDKLILVTPYDSIAAVGQGFYPWAPVSLLIKDRFDSIAVCENIDVPTLFLVAERDEVIPRKHSQKLADEWSSNPQWLTIEGSDHNSITSFQDYWQAIESFLSSQ